LKVKVAPVGPDMVGKNSGNVFVIVISTSSSSSKKKNDRLTSYIKFQIM